MGISILLVYYLLFADIQNNAVMPFMLPIAYIVFVIAGILLLTSITLWIIRHEAYNVLRYAKTHSSLIARLEKALLEARFTIKEKRIGHNTIVRLPKVELHFSDSALKRGILKIQNHLNYDRPLECDNISSALGHYIVEERYLTDDENYYVFHIKDSREVRLIFDSKEVFTTFCDQESEPYELLLDRNNKVKIAQTAVLGQTGSGKSYTLYSLILQLLNKPYGVCLWFVDPKLSGLGRVGKMIAPERTAEKPEEILSLLEKLYAVLEVRQVELQERLEEKLDADWKDFSITPHILFLEELGALVAVLNKQDKEAVISKLKAITMIGRQLGILIYLVMQQPNAQDLPTSIRENLECKIVMGSSEPITYETAFGSSMASKIPARKRLPGQALYTCSGVTNTEPRPCTFPTLNFDIGKALTE